MKNLIKLLVVMLLFASCNPCKFVAKHAECFPADSVIIEKEVVRYQKEYITNDSIIRDTVPCDPVTKTYYKTQTVYQTKTIEKTDTIYTEKTVNKLNPVNTKLKQQNEKLNAKIEQKNKVIRIGSIVFLLLLIALLLIIKFK